MGTATSKLSNTANKPVQTFKACIRSSGAGGATSLADVAAGSGFNPNTDATIGTNFENTLEHNVDGEPCRFKLWDLASHPRFDGVTHAYLPGAAAYIACLDLTDSRVAPSIIEAVKDSPLAPNTLVFLVANKSDLKSHCVYTEEKVKDIADKIGATAHFFCSAKTGEGVEDAFGTMLRLTYERQNELAKGDSEVSEEQQLPLPAPGVLQQGMMGRQILPSAPPLNPPDYTEEPGDGEVRVALNPRSSS